MVEKEIKNCLLDQLKLDFPEWQVEDFPLDVNLFITNKLTNNTGAILLKSIGIQPTFLQEGTRTGVMRLGGLVNYNYEFGVVILARSYETQDQMIDLTKRIILSLTMTDTSSIDQNSGFFLERVFETEYDDQNKLFNRKLYIAINTFELEGY